MTQNNIKKLILNLFLFILIYIIIFYSANYLTKKILNLAQEINNLNIEKEIRLNNYQNFVKIQNFVNQVEKKYNTNLNKLNEELSQKKLDNKSILEFVSTTKINISEISENSILIFNDKVQNFLKFIKFLQENEVGIDYFRGRIENNNLNLEIKIK
ncbi:MAG: hypothetical protein KatS3mg094_478 [Candidatus Parcubacteria bacterium]|nr:MAG: hypothetical protein KatS3mg094_478 [Candidatus Parcubacteria bacterium]